MESQPNFPPKFVHLALISILGFIVAVGLLVSFAVFAMANVDAQSLERQRGFAASGLRLVFDRVPKEQESITIWDDAVVKVRQNDQTWMAENIGEWVTEYFGHDQVYVLNPRDEPIHATNGGATVAPAAYLEHESLIAPLAKQLRSKMAEATVGLADSSAVVGELGATSVILQGATPALVSVKPIVAYSEDVAVLPGSEFLHISIRRVDEDLLSEIGRMFALKHLRLLNVREVADAHAAVPIADDAGRIFGFLTWDGNRPGTKMVLDAAPGLGAAIGVGAVLLGWLLFRLLRSSAQLTASQAQTQFLAFHDTLTGLPNRALFEDRLDRALVEARRSGKHVALHAIDIDRFKNINDTRGHPAGDELIRLVASRLSSVLRECDTVARLGGDEFAVVQTEVTHMAEAEVTAERMLRAINEPCELLGERAHVSASIGVVVFTGSEANRSELFRKADIALYEAKARGRARFQLFAGDMDDIVKRRRLIEEELRLALELGDQLKVVYQPIFTPGGKDVLGAEALVRWDHPIHGRLAPDLFISIAEERALIEPLGEFVLREAALFALEAELPWIAVNVSPIQFRNPLFASKVFTILDEVGLEPKRLQIEITEGVLLDNVAVIEQTLGQLRSGGVQIALDDFGTGYSSMSYLRRYAIDKLKIDRSFVAELGSSPDADAIIRAMVVMARSLKLQVTAEGVETTEQRDHLAALGCHELQGYLLSRPLAPADFAALSVAPNASRIAMQA